MVDVENSARIRAAKRMLFSGIPVVFTIGFCLLSGFATAPRLHRVIITGLAAACAPFVVDLVQLVSGISFRVLISKWDSLRGWQRGAIGTGIVVAFMVLLFTSIGFVLTIFQ